MMPSLLLAVGMAAGMDLRVLALVAGALWFPLPSAIALVFAVVATRRLGRARNLGTEIRFLDALIAELRSGSSTRQGLAVVCESLPGGEPLVRRLQSGQPMPASVAGLGEILPGIGPLVEQVLAVDGDGGRLIPALEELSDQAEADAATDDEWRTAMAPVAASMWVLVGGPFAYSIWLFVSGRMVDRLTVPGGAWMATVGAAVFLTGVASMWVMVRFAR